MEEEEGFIRGDVEVGFAYIRPAGVAGVVGKGVADQWAGTFAYCNYTIAGDAYSYPACLLADVVAAYFEPVETGWFDSKVWVLHGVHAPTDDEEGGESDEDFCGFVHDVVYWTFGWSSARAIVKRDFTWRYVVVGFWGGMDQGEPQRVQRTQRFLG